ncbi:MAG: ATP-binding protein [Planctomycetota bacterium]
MDEQILGPHTKFEMTFSSDPERLTSIRGLLEVCSIQYHYAQEVMDDLILALDEAISNIIRHAYGENPNYLILFKCVFEPKRAQFFLYDQGKGFDPNVIAKPDVKKYVKEEKKGGWGKFLIERVMDQIQYTHSHNGNLLYCVKFIEPQKNRKIDTDLWKQKALNIEDIHSLEELHQQIISVVDALNNENYREMAVNIIVKILTNNLDIPVLLQSFLLNILTKTNAQYGLIYLRDLQEPERFLLSQKIGVTSQPHPEFSETAPWIQMISEIKFPIRNHQKYHLGFDWDTLFPMLVGGKVEGLFFLGKKMNGDIYTQEEEKLLFDLTSLAGIGYRNAKLFTQVWESKKLLESSLDHFSHLVTIIDADYRLVRVNKTLMKHFDFKKFNQVLGKRCYEVLYGKTKPCKSCPVQQIIETKKEVILERTHPETQDHYGFNYLPRFNVKKNVEHIIILWRFSPAPPTKNSP